ncbi:MAG: M20/M25/M40 family metallo-hydrolase [Phycisphaerales bacterium]
MTPSLRIVFTLLFGIAIDTTTCGASLESPEPPTEAIAGLLDEVSEENLHHIVSSLAAFGTRHTLSDTESDERGIGAARRWIFAEFERYAADSGRSDEGPEAIQVYFDSYDYGPDRRRVDRPIEVVNVVMEVPGVMPEARTRRYYIIGHYDSRASSAMDIESHAPGANDDASGVAATMELARVMSRLQFDATLVFMATAGEEQGLLGARLHADRAAKEGLDIRAVLSNDIIGDPTAPSGARHDTRVRVFSEGVPRRADASELARLRSLAGEHDSSSRQLARYIAEIAEWHELPVRPMLVFRPDRFLRGGDHSAFNDAGFAAVRFCEVEENYTRQHQDLRTEDGVEYGDTVDHVDMAYLANVTRLNGATLASLANAPSEPGNARIITAGLSNDTTLRWDAAPELDVAGYEVVWRETTSPVWTHSDDVGDATETTLPLSKDNYFFGVRSYDEAGFRSPVAWPIAAPR